jgi:hypothetical protein
MLALLGVSPLVLGATSSPVTVYRAKRIITMDNMMPSASLVAVADGAIVAVANTLSAMSRQLGSRAFQLDTRFENAVLMPGLIDPHVHPTQSAIMLNLPFVAPEDWVLPNWRGPMPIRLSVGAIMNCSTARLIVRSWIGLLPTGRSSSGSAAFTK